MASTEDSAEVDETLSVLSDPDALADIREADAAYARGDVTRGVETSVGSAPITRDGDHYLKDRRP